MYPQNSWYHEQGKGNLERSDFHDTFPKGGSTLTDPSDFSKRNQDLNRAMTLGNLEHGKVKIHFLDAQHNFYLVETTVWAVTEEYLCLKGDLQIPTCAVLRID